MNINLFKKQIRQITKTLKVELKETKNPQRKKDLKIQIEKNENWLQTGIY
tara:strand:+ start:528 stop:677 length:150 start_codon:yes stop_codon:yes gene_type:complete